MNVTSNRFKIKKNKKIQDILGYFPKTLRIFFHIFLDLSENFPNAPLYFLKCLPIGGAP